MLALDRRPIAAGGPGALLAITADHGNADVMRDAAGGVVTAHSLSPVPFLLAGSAVRGRGLRDGVLADVAPTLLDLAGLDRRRGHDRPLRRARGERPSGTERGRAILAGRLVPP